MTVIFFIAIVFFALDYSPYVVYKRLITIHLTVAPTQPNEGDKTGMQKLFYYQTILKQKTYQSYFK